MTLRPRAAKDLLLAPLAVEIDMNLQELREKSAGEIEEELEIRLDINPARADRAQRETWILDAALRLIDMHGWDAEITNDAARLRLSGGSVTIDLGLSATILQYIESGVR